MIIPVRGGVGDLASIYSLNKVGSFLWQSLAQPASLQMLTTLLHGEFEVEAHQAQEEISEFLEELKIAGLIAVTEQGTGSATESSARGMQP